MNMDELKKQLAALGVKADDLTEDVKEKLQAWLDDQKAQLDTETRRKVRAFWAGVACVALVVGYAVGFCIARVAG